MQLQGKSAERVTLSPSVDEWLGDLPPLDVVNGVYFESKDLTLAHAKDKNLCQTWVVEWNSQPLKAVLVVACISRTKHFLGSSKFLFCQHCPRKAIAQKQS